jgi:hypothetical protein
MIAGSTLVSVGLLSVERADTQTAANAAGDLWAENKGHAIWFWWENQSGTTEYIMYRSTSPRGLGRSWAVLTKNRQEREGQDR